MANAFGIITLTSESQALGEKNDCTVRALAVVTGAGYREAHAKMAAQGRSKGLGATPSQYRAAAKELGFETQDISFRSKTAITIERELKACYPGDKFFVGFDGHVAGFDGKKLADWVKGRRNRVTELTRVYPISEPQAVVTTPAPAPEPKVKPRVVAVVKPRKSSFKFQIRAALQAGQKISATDFPGITESNYSIILSQLQNPKYAGKLGPMKIHRERGTGRAWLV